MQNTKRFLIMSLTLLLLASTVSAGETILFIAKHFKDILETKGKVVHHDFGLRLRDRLDELGYKCKQSQLDASFGTSDYLFCFGVPGNLEPIKALRKEQCVLFIWEPPSIHPQNFDRDIHKYFGTIFTWDDSLVDNLKYFKFNYPEPCRRTASELRHLLRNKAIPLIEYVKPVEVDFAEKKLCTMVCSNKSSKHKNELFSKRRAIIDYFEQHNSDDFDLYGRGWKNNLKNYRGSPKNKIECIQKYKFYICYENMYGIDGYITEKLFDCFFAGCVPIYWGASNIADFVPAGCFIDRREFNTFEDLHKYIKEMSQEKYEQYLENIRVYLKSDKAQNFTIHSFIKKIIEVLGLDCNRIERNV